jgi:phosphohistidine phosphatase SixA
MKLLIIRHADALDIDGNSIRTDFERPLSEKGIKQSIRLRKSLENAHLIPEIVLSSPLIRTSQTSKLVFPDIFSQNMSQTGIKFFKISIYPEFKIKIPIDVIF